MVGLDATENVLAAPEAELPSVEEIKLPTLVEKVALIPDKEFCIRIYCYWPPKKEDCQQWYCSECVWCPKKSSSLQAASSEAHFIGLAATEEVLADTWPGDPTRTPLILKFDADLDAAWRILRVMSSLTCSEQVFAAVHGNSTRAI